jgi:pimeloyl-ACP methyl ester carboxylesterase
VRPELFIYTLANTTAFSELSPMTAIKLGPDTVNWLQLGEYFDFDGHRIFFRDSGDSAKPVLLLIHGFPSASWDWQPVWPELSQTFRLIAADMLGFGFSSKPRKHDYNIHQQADIQEALLAHLGIQQCHALVHDYGVSVQQELMARQHEQQLNFRLLSSCFLNGGVFPEMHRPRLIQRLLLSPAGPLLSPLNNQRQFERSFSAVFGPNTRPSKTELRSFWELIAYNQGQRIFHLLIRYMNDRKQHRQRWVNALVKPQMPVRLINGPEDPVSGRHLVEYYQQLVTNADTVVLDSIGHYPQVEAPELVTAAYLEFVQPLL